MESNDWECWGSEKIPLSPNSSVSNSSLVIEFLAWFEHARHRAKRTVETYGESLQSYVGFLGAVDVRCADVAMMEAWMMGPRMHRGKGQIGAASTQRKDTAVLRFVEDK